MKRAVTTAFGVLMSLSTGCDFDPNREILRCEPSAGLGQACGRRGVGECAEGLSCAGWVCEVSAPGVDCLIQADCGPTDELICRQRRCRVRAELQEQGGDCEDHAECAVGLICLTVGPEGQRSCVPLLETQTICREDSDCPETSSFCCRDAGCPPANGGGGCQPRVDRGEPCRTTKGCLQGLVCTRDLVCGDAPTLGEDCLDRCDTNLSCEPN